MNINGQTNASIHTRVVIVIFTNKSMLLLVHQLYQLTELHHSFMKVFMVWSAVDDVYIALCLIMIYNNAFSRLQLSLFFFVSPSFMFIIILITLKYKKET